MSHFEQESNKNINVLVITMFICIYFFIGLIISSYIGEKYNRQISVKEYINITLNIPVFLFAEIYRNIEKEFKDTTPILERCIVRCNKEYYEKK